MTFWISVWTPSADATWCLSDAENLEEARCMAAGELVGKSARACAMVAQILDDEFQVTDFKYKGKDWRRCNEENMK